MALTYTAKTTTRHVRSHVARCRGRAPQYALRCTVHATPSAHGRPFLLCVTAMPSEMVQSESVRHSATAQATSNAPDIVTPTAQHMGLRALLTSTPYDPCVIFKGEHYWRDRSIWLKEHGYTLRPRYSPDWKPSWVWTNKHWTDCEDSCSIPGVCVDVLRSHTDRH